MPKYKIKWKSLLTNGTGEGLPIFTKDEAENIVKKQNKKHQGEIHHWAEPVHDDIRIISIKQPWASLIVNGIKQIENRSRISHYRGKLFIHASLKFDDSAMDFISETFGAGICNFADRQREMRGGIIGHVDMINCVDKHTSHWFTGPYGYVFEKAKQIPLIPCKGQLGIFRAKGELLKCLASK